MQELNSRLRDRAICRALQLRYLPEKEMTGHPLYVITSATEKQHLAEKLEAWEKGAAMEAFTATQNNAIRILEEMPSTQQYRKHI